MVRRLGTSTYQVIGLPGPDLYRISAICIVRQADAGWSSSVARRAHNPEVTGSNPVPATSSPSALELAGVSLMQAAGGQPHARELGNKTGRRGTTNSPRAACFRQPLE